MSWTSEKITSIFHISLIVSYHIWMEAGSWRVTVMRSTMQYESVVKMRRTVMPVVRAWGSTAAMMTQMAEKK